MYMPEMLWSLYFIQSQRYTVDCVNGYQDNISTQLLMKNGRFLSRKKTTHINAKFFFINNRIDGEELEVINCPTESMWADVLTKPLQGMAFKQNHARLMNCPVEYDEADKTISTKLLIGKVSVPFQTPQECAGNNKNLRHTTNRPIGVSRILRRVQPPAWRWRRE